MRSSTLLFPGVGAKEKRDFSLSFFFFYTLPHTLAPQAPTRHYTRSRATLLRSHTRCRTQGSMISPALFPGVGEKEKRVFYLFLLLHATTHTLTQTPTRSYTLSRALARSHTRCRTQGSMRSSTPSYSLTQSHTLSLSHSETRCRMQGSMRSPTLFAVAPILPHDLKHVVLIWSRSRRPRRALRGPSRHHELFVGAHAPVHGLVLDGCARSLLGGSSMGPLRLRRIE
jgi:hypothetical protein